MSSGNLQKNLIDLRTNRPLKCFDINTPQSSVPLVFFTID